MNCANWENVSNQVNIGVHTEEEGEVEFSIRVREFTTLDAYPEDVGVKASIIHDAYKEINVINESGD